MLRPMMYIGLQNIGLRSDTIIQKLSIARKYRYNNSCRISSCYTTLTFCTSSGIASLRLRFRMFVELS